MYYAYYDMHIWYSTYAYIFIKNVTLLSVVCWSFFWLFLFLVFVLLTPFRVRLISCVRWTSFCFSYIYMSTYLYMGYMLYTVEIMEYFCVRIFPPRPSQHVASQVVKIQTFPTRSFKANELTGGGSYWSRSLQLGPLHPTHLDDFAFRTIILKCM